MPLFTSNPIYVRHASLAMNAADEPGASDWTTAQQISTVNAKLYGLTIANKSTTDDFWVQIFDLATAPVGAEVPDFDLLVPMQSFLPFAFNAGRQYRNGIYVRAVTAQGGSTLVASNIAKFTWDIQRGPQY